MLGVRSCSFLSILRQVHDLFSKYTTKTLVPIVCASDFDVIQSCINLLPVQFCQFFHEKNLEKKLLKKKLLCNQLF